MGPFFGYFLEKGWVSIVVDDFFGFDLEFGVYMFSQTCLQCGPIVISLKTKYFRRLDVCSWGQGEWF